MRLLPRTVVPLLLAVISVPNAWAEDSTRNAINGFSDLLRWFSTGSPNPPAAPPTNGDFECEIRNNSNNEILGKIRTDSEDPDPKNTYLPLSGEKRLSTVLQSEYAEILRLSKQGKERVTFKLDENSNTIRIEDSEKPGNHEIATVKVTGALAGRLLQSEKTAKHFKIALLQMVDKVNTDTYMNKLRSEATATFGKANGDGSKVANEGMPNGEPGRAKPDTGANPLSPGVDAPKDGNPTGFDPARR